MVFLSVAVLHRFYTINNLVNTYPPLFLCLLFKSGAYIQVHCRQHIFIEANNMNPDQTAQSRSDKTNDVFLKR